MTTLDPSFATRAPVARKAGPPRLVLGLFVLSLMVPVILTVGPFNLPPSRLFLLILFFPAVFFWITGQAGRIRTVDILIGMTTAWWVLSLFYNHPIGGIFQQAGFTVLETFGAYMVGRTFVRTPQAFTLFVRYCFLAVLVMLPFAIVETQTGRPILIEALRRVATTVPIITYEPRLGLERAQVVFQHPILYGIFCAATFGMVVHVLNRNASHLTAVFRGAVVTVATITSVSTGAFLTLVLQFGFIAYNRILARIPWRWTLFAGLFALVYIVIDIGSTRTPFHVFVSYLTLNTGTAYNRILIFEYGMQNVARSPIFGIGLRDWIRPIWMVPSVDNFWLLITMRHGYPGLLLFLGAILLLIRQLSFTELKSAEARAIRTGYLVSLGGFMIAAVTVYIWSGIYIWFLFLLGAGVWMLDWQEGEETPAGPARRRPLYSRQKGAASEPSEPEVTAEEPVSGTRYTRFAHRTHIPPR